MRLALLFCSLCVLLLSSARTAESGKGEKGKKKNVLDLSERDVQRIYEQWEVYVTVHFSYSDSDSVLQFSRLLLSG